jgi:16S rRNA (guanine527-N7)-methyltransferase
MTMNMVEPETTEILKKGLLSLGLNPSDDQMKCFAIYLSYLKKWNKACNLTGIRNDEDIVIKHFLDSLLYLKAIPRGSLRVADVGSGAGFPGIPLKIVRPELEMFLIEPSGKKAAFLRHIARRLQIDKMEIIEKRVEEIQVSQELKAAVDIVLTRALFTIKEFVRGAAHIVKPTGIFMLSKGPKVTEELQKAEDLEFELLKIPLPHTDIMRYIVIVKGKRTAVG